MEPGAGMKMEPRTMFHEKFPFRWKLSTDMNAFDKLTGIGIPDLETPIMEEIWGELNSVCWQYEEDGDSKWIFLYPNKLQKLRKLLLLIDKALSFQYSQETEYWKQVLLQIQNKISMKIDILEKKETYLQCCEELKTFIPLQPYVLEQIAEHGACMEPATGDKLRLELNQALQRLKKKKEDAQAKFECWEEAFYAEGESGAASSIYVAGGKPTMKISFRQMVDMGMGVLLGWNLQELSQGGFQDHIQTESTILTPTANEELSRTYIKKMEELKPLKDCLLLQLQDEDRGLQRAAGRADLHLWSSGESTSSSTTEERRTVLQQCMRVLQSSTDDIQQETFINSLIEKINAKVLDFMECPGLVESDFEYISQCHSCVAKINAKLQCKNNSVKNNSQKVKIKDLDLPTFSGLEQDYFSFLSNLTELLKNSKLDQPSQLISVKNLCFNSCPSVKSIVSCCVDLDELFEILNQRFGNRERHSARLVGLIGSIPNCTDHPKTVINMADTIFKISREAEQAKALSQIISFQSIFAIKEKFSSQMKRDYVKEYGVETNASLEVEWSNVMSFLKDEMNYAISLSAMGSSAVGTSHAPPKKGNGSSPFFVKPKISSVSMRKLSCIFCNGPHPNFDRDCPMTGDKCTPETRVKLDKSNICVTCLCPKCRPDCKRFACKEGCRIKNKPANYRVCDCRMAESLHNKMNPNIRINKTPISSRNSQFGKTLLMCEKVSILNERTKKFDVVQIFIDSGATDSLSSKRIGWTGRLLGKQDLKVGGFSHDAQENIYGAHLVNFKVKTQHGLRDIQTIQVNRLSGVNPCQVKVPPQWRGKFSSSSYQVREEVDLLLGADNAGLFPKEVDRWQDGADCLILYKSMITGNYLLFGRNSQLLRFQGNAHSKISKATVGAAERFESDELDPICWKSDKKVPKTFFQKMQNNFFSQLTCEQLDEGSSSEHEKRKKLLDEEQLKDGISFDADRKCWVARYLYSNQLSKLQDNYFRTRQRMVKLNEKLQKKPVLCAAVNNEIFKNIGSGYWKRVSELDLPSGLQKHFLPFTYVENDKSKSTPVRIVTDSSARDSGGLSLNMCQRAGNSEVGNLRGVLLRARVSQNIALGDITKFYHSFRLEPADISLRRILVPKGGFGEVAQWEEFAEVTVPFGDKAAGVLSTMARVKKC